MLQSLRCFALCFIATYVYLLPSSNLTLGPVMMSSVYIFYSYKPISLWLTCYHHSFQLLKWPSPLWPWQAGQSLLWMSPGQPATPSATPSLCPTPPKMAPSLSPNLLTMTPPTLWPPSNLAPLTELRWRLWGREMKQMDREQWSWGISLLRVRGIHTFIECAFFH